MYPRFHDCGGVGLVGCRRFSEELRALRRLTNNAPPSYQALLHTKPKHPTGSVESFPSPLRTPYRWLFLVSGKVLGSSVLRRTRGSEITIRSETRLSSCSPLGADEALASYSWTLVAANESYPREHEVAVEDGRDPRVLVIPAHTLGYAGSSYLFQLRTTFGSELANAANATSE